MPPIPPRRWSVVARAARRAACALAAAAAAAGVAAGTGLPAAAEDVSAPAILQWFESTYRTQERRAADVFAAGYGGVWLPPPGRADTGNFSVGYDVYDRFDLGSPGNPTLYGTETGLKTAIRTLQRAGGTAVYIDYVGNHNGYSGTNLAEERAAFVAAGDYPGFVLSTGSDVDGDFHSAFPPGGPDYDLQYRLAGLIDIDQRKDHRFVRNPVPGFANNIPAGTTPQFGRLADVPRESNRRFYPDRDLQPIMVYDPRTGEADIPIYPFNTANPMAGDPVEENAMGYLMRYAQWMVQEVGVDGFRIDAARHMYPFAHDYFDRAVYRADRRTYLDGSPRHVFSFLEAYTGDKAYLQSFVRKDIDPSQVGVVGGNRDVLDFPLFFAMRDNLTGNGLVNDWRNIKNASQDVQDDGLANNGSQAVAFVVSHDDGGPHLSNVAHAYVLMRPGNAVVYFNAREHGDGRDFPKDGRGDALGGLYGDRITTLVNLRNTHGRGNYIDRTPGGDEKEMLVYERRKSVLVVLSNRLDGGFDSRTIATSFEPGQWLVELTGNASDPTIDPFNDFPEVLQVNGDRTVNLRVPRNRAPGANGAQHDSGYFVYGLAGPRGTLTVGGVHSTLEGGAPTAATNGATRLSEIDVIKGDTITVTLATTAANHLGFARDPDADGDNALFKIDEGLDLNGNGQVDFRTPGSVVYGFEQFTHTRTPGTTTATGDGLYAQTIDASALGEGYHFLEVRAFRRRTDGGPAIYTPFKRTLYVDRLPPVSAVESFDPITEGVNENRRAVVRSTDLTADNVHVFLDLPAALTDAQVLAMVGGTSQASAIDRDLWTRDFGNLTHGNHVLTAVTYEITGTSNVQRFPGRFTSTIFGAGLGDTNFNGSYGPDDVGLFATVLASGDAQFNPAADLTGDGRVGEADLLALQQRFAAVNAGPATWRAYNDLLISPAGGQARTVNVPLNNAAGSALTRSGGGTVTIAGPQVHGPGATLAVNGGVTNLDSDAGSAAAANLAVTVNGSAVVNVNATQHLRALTVNPAARVNVAGGRQVALYAAAIGFDDGALDLADGTLILDSTPGQVEAQREALEAFARAGRTAAGVGLLSTLAGDHKTLAVVPNDDAPDAPHYASFRGHAVPADAILVALTWEGDLDLDGLVDARDYYRIDRGRALGLTGYANGDVDHSGGAPTADDYVLMDAAFLAGASSTSAFAAGAPPATSVPEPAAPPLLLLAGAGALLHPRRRPRGQSNCVRSSTR